ncbi:MAG: hypothetical protein VYA55_12660 [Pseudomonadota bacterium]|nr:hypothetical protein [Pseudomonadota bacterium]
MHYDAQIQMIVSTFKLSQTLDVDPETGKASMRYRLKCSGGARSSSFDEAQAVVTILEASRLQNRSLGSIQQQDGRIQIQMVAPRDYFSGLLQLFPHCRPEDGGYLSFDFLLSGSEPMQVLSAEYKMVKQLSDNPDLIHRT